MAENETPRQAKHGSKSRPQGGGKDPRREQGAGGRPQKRVAGREQQAAPAGRIGPGQVARRQGDSNAPVRRPGKKPETEAVATISPARGAAFELLQRIASTTVHSDDVLHGPRMAGLSQVDRDLTMALVLGVFRWQIALDSRMVPLLSRPDLALAQAAQIALRLGAFQLLHMDRIPAHAAINESVELVRAAGQPQTAGLVNAVLRKLVGARPVRKPLVEPLPVAAERLGHPLWLVERWVAQYGRQSAEAICEFDQNEPACEAIFADTAEGAIPAPVMDAGSRLVAEIAALARPAAQRVWDCCAAPGGKAMVLARHFPEAEVLMTDASPVRLKRLGQRLGREMAGREVRLELADAAVLPGTFGDFDLILCDVPCGGTGTLARNPEIRHRLRPQDLARQAERQRRILSGALEHLAVGGVLVYSTCSLEAEECEAVVEAELAGNEAVQRRPVEPLLARMHETGLLKPDEGTRSRWTRDGYLRTLPGAGFTGDGFFAAVLERV